MRKEFPNIPHGVVLLVQNTATFISQKQIELIPLHNNNAIQTINGIINSFLKPKTVIKLESMEVIIMFAFLYIVSVVLFNNY